MTERDATILSLVPLVRRLARRVLRAVERERFALAAREGAMPSERTLEERFPQYRASAAEVAERNPLSLDSPLPDRVRVPIDWSGDPLLAVLRNERDAAIGAGLARLPRRKRTVVVDHYLHGQTLAAVGSTLGVTRQRVSQLHISALQDLRALPYVHAAH